MTRLVVTGSTGQVGRELVAAAVRRGWTVTGLSRSEAQPCDLTHAAQVRARIGAAQPDLIVHTAAWTDVDACEGDPAMAHALNVDATRNVAAAAREVGAHVTYLSTDYVYDGTKAEPYVEDDPTGPLSVYGRTKLAGEQALDPTAAIVRTSWVSGRHGANAVRTILRLAAAGDGPLRFVDDQRGNPTLAADLAAATLDLAADRVAGVVHVTNQGTVSWFDLAREVLDLAGHDPGRVLPIATAELDPPRAATRPANSALAPGALTRLGHPLLRHHRPALAELIGDLLADRPGG